jgi:hypothetical protein
MLSDFGDMLPHEVTIAPKTGSDRFNKTTYGAAVEHKALVVDAVQMVRAQNGQVTVSNTTVYLDGPCNDELDAESRVVLPSGRSYPILSINRFPDEHGDYIAVVYM